MSRNIPDRPHPTPDPERSHGAARIDRSGPARAMRGASGSSEHLANPAGESEPEEPTYDSCFDDLNVVLSQSMEEPDPDPNLEAPGVGAGPGDGEDPEAGRPASPGGNAPRTSEIFRSVVAPGPDPTSAPGPSPGDAAELPDLGLLDHQADPAAADVAGDRDHDARIPWGQIALLSYASVLTLALIWLLGTGRIPRAAAPDSPAAERSAAEPALHPAPSPPDAPPPPDGPPPPLPPENIATPGQTIRLGDLEVTPLSIEAGPVELVHAIDADDRRYEPDCLMLRLRLTNRSKGQTFSPMDRILVRDRDLQSFDPYIATSGGPGLRLFPLAMDSEWSIVGQDFPVLRPGESAETSVAAEPGSANRLADEMTWRVRLRIGVYRSDMLGVRFTRREVRHRAGGREDDGE